ncbi:type I methionyl aminopeptidase [Psittacicella melopsittaci]|uniref:Methionine aminopeptidase n=1 Tax=Psittacicella melopsittaci TaxID=2028576 RepID=A0A3A1Y7W2_9GAMM|nr:type I methionyl aminopeptidase [Psittacicella melopsittaci]RIY32217.1 type I methionyl aminopeptidase [Psittacicella melopsittaci]
MSTKRKDGIVIYSPEEIEKIRIACKIAAQTLEYMDQFVKPGVTTLELDRIAHDYMVNVQKVIPACLNYHGFPNSICTSVNEVICHGIPSDKQILREGDIINIDLTVIKDGYYGDNSKMYVVGGETNKRTQDLVDATLESLYAAIRVCKPGAKFNEIGDAIHKVVAPYSFSIVRSYIGHGIGDEFHQAPEVLHYPNNWDVEMEEGMVFTIEPMINAGDWRDRTLKDGWTAVTRDKKDSAQYEHQLLIIPGGVEVMTIRKEEELEGRISRIMINE